MIEVSIHTASRESRVASFVGLGLGLGWGLSLASQASRVYLRGVPIHTATGMASREYSISLYTRLAMKVNFHPKSEGSQSQKKKKHQS